MGRYKTKIIATLLLLMPFVGWCADDGKQLVVVSTSALTHYWAVDQVAMPANLAYFEVSGSDGGAGCINVGYVIEHDGTTSAQRVLKEALMIKIPG